MMKRGEVRAQPEIFNWITSWNSTATGAESPGSRWIGTQFSVVASIQMIGFAYYASANETLQDLPFSLFDQGGVPIATGTLLASQIVRNGWAYVDLPVPISLIPGQTYVVAAFMLFGHVRFSGVSGRADVRDVATLLGHAHSANPTTQEGNKTFTLQAAPAIFSTSFRYSIAPPPEQNLPKLLYRDTTKHMSGEASSMVIYGQYTLPAGFFARPNARIRIRSVFIREGAGQAEAQVYFGTSVFGSRSAAGVLEDQWTDVWRIGPSQQQGFTNMNRNNTFVGQLQSPTQNENNPIAISARGRSAAAGGNEHGLILFEVWDLTPEV
jgi:hypothetical protein